ncbi:hypothetical protein RUM44_004159 [Polyplax serrata]|uniref:Uncharacterized protein n=1 Tax=Polyplax serrata TaxID=468196 RepID=A0ABR1B3T1_POLSC
MLENPEELDSTTDSGLSEFSSTEVLEPEQYVPGIETPFCPQIEWKTCSSMPQQSFSHPSDLIFSRLHTTNSRLRCNKF